MKGSQDPKEIDTAEFSQYGDTLRKKTKLNNPQNVDQPEQKEAAEKVVENISQRGKKKDKLKQKTEVKKSNLNKNLKPIIKWNGILKTIQKHFNINDETILLNLITQFENKKPSTGERSK